ncbi:MAG: DsrE family protein [Candidatus Thermoplasmatota archaeon]|nr:DsrE family protein [Candidatus Thermoplasmatota archaeon]
MAKKILYVQTSGTDSPDRLYAPFILATTARAMGIDATVYFLGKGVTVVMKGNAEKIKLGNFPTVKQVMDQAAKEGVKMLICGQSCQMLGLNGAPEEFEDPAKVVGAATLNDLLLDADAVLSF